jgi:hypothetical protein
MHTNITVSESLAKFVASPAVKQMIGIASGLAHQQTAEQRKPLIPLSVKNNRLLSEQVTISKAQLEFLLSESEANKSSSSLALRLALMANIIAVIAIAIETKESIITMFISWFY